MNQLRTLIKFSFTFDFDSAVRGVGMESLHLGRAAGVFYLQKLAKIEVNRGENYFCTEDVSAQLGHGKETLLNFMKPMTKVFY